MARRTTRFAGGLVAVVLSATALAGCSAPDPLPGGAAHSDRVELERGDVTLEGTLVVPELDPQQQVPLVILMHGYGGWSDEVHLVRTSEQLQAAGVASLRVDFTGHGRSGGSFQSFSDMAVTEVDDAQAIYDFAAALPFESSISLVGYSLGGLIAAHAAGELGDAITSVVLLAPAPTYGVYVPVLDSAAKYEGPVLILQGDSDQLVSVEVAERYAAAFENSELRVLPHENHAFTYGTDVEGMTVQFVTEHAPTT